jgi:hypothetical protein
MPTFQTAGLEERDAALHKQREVDKPDVAQADVPRTADSQVPISNPGSLTPAAVLQLQRSVGNQAVGQLLEDRVTAQAPEAGQPLIQRSLEEEEELECPGSAIRSGGLGRGEGTGEGSGPIGYPKEDEW